MSISMNAGPFEEGEYRRVAVNVAMEKIVE